MGETANHHKVGNESVMSRGIGAGWDAANFAAAYGTGHGPFPGETFDQEAARRAREEYPDQPTAQRSYEQGFAVGVSRFCKDQYPDGTRMD